MERSGQVRLHPTEAEDGVRLSRCGGRFKTLFVLVTFTKFTFNRVVYAEALDIHHASGTKPTSAASPRIMGARARDGEGDARRKAGLMECNESRLLFLVKGGQEAGPGR